MNIPASVIKICRRLNEAGFEAFLVGGAVRDYLLKRDPKDWDVATNAHPEQVIGLFDKVIPTGVKFGTVTVLEEIGVEVTTYRCDGKYSDGRRPEDVVFTENIHADLARRDLTINAMALNPIGDMEIVDPFCGQQDLNDRIIRAVGDPMERFSEDGLRPMRAVRFASQLNFEVEKYTLKAIARSYNVFSMVSMERIRDELVKILNSNCPDVGVRLLVETGLMGYVIPAFMATRGVVQNHYHTNDVYEHSISALQWTLSDDPIFRLAVLLHDIGKPDTATPSSRKGEFHFYDHAKIGALYVEGITKRLKFSTDEVKRITHLVQHHMRLVDPPKTDPGLRRMIRDLGAKNMNDFMSLRFVDLLDAKNYASLSIECLDIFSKINKILDEKHPLEIKDLVIDGEDVMTCLGVEPGPEVGKALNYLMEAVLEDPSLNTKESLGKLLESMNG